MLRDFVFCNMILGDEGGKRFFVATTKEVVDNPQLSRTSVTNSTTYQISCSNEVLGTDLKTSRVIWLVVTFPGSRHFACDDFVATRLKGGLGGVNRDFRGAARERLRSGRAPN